LAGEAIGSGGAGYFEAVAHGEGKAEAAAAHCQGPARGFGQLARIRQAGVWQARATEDAVKIFDAVAADAAADPAIAIWRGSGGLCWPIRWRRMRCCRGWFLDRDGNPWRGRGAEISASPPSAPATIRWPIAT
jgi:hypothetical protein